MRLWDRLLPQTILTLNLLRQSNAVPTISAWQYVHGQFDYNKMPLAPMGCAVQIHQGSERRASWAANAIDGWYLQISPEHYRCHVIYIKQTKNERISDTVFFKTKYITQPTLSRADIVSKALNDLTQALKGKSNERGLEQIDALKRLDAILTNEPETTTETPMPRPSERRVTFAETANAPTEAEPREETPAPRVTTQPQRNRTEPIHAATIEKQIPRASLPRVPGRKSTKEITPARIEMRERIRKHIEPKTMARIPQRRTYLQQQVRMQERAQTIHDKETNTYLRYQQLLRHPNYTKAWNISAANEFGRLAQGLKDGRVKGTDTIRFIQKDEVPSDRMKDVTYGSFSCDFKPNKEEKERTRLTTGRDRINYPDNCGRRQT